MTKLEIRQTKLRERDAIDPALRAEWAEAMCLSIEQSFEYQNAQTLHVFLPLGSEPDTMPFIRRAWADGKKVLVPFTIPGEQRMKHAQYASHDMLTKGEFGVSVPLDVRLYTDDQLTESNMLVVVPLVAFNQQLFRIGYGKGYYDRFLESRQCFAFGFAFSCAFSAEFVPESHDVQLDALITEQGLVRGRRSQDYYNLDTQL